jgi:hypothetical protein
MAQIMINDITGWQVIDEYPETPLDTIVPISKRATSLIARNKTKASLLNTNFLEIQGAVEMMQGLDYHHDNFMKLINRLVEFDLTDEAHGLKISLSHEVVAYLNRMGQFYYFIDSEFIKKHCSTAKSLAPTIDKFFVFRRKHSAHRSIDQRRGESLRVRETQAMSMSSIGPKIFETKPGQSCNLLEAKTKNDAIEHIRNNWKKCYWICQLITDDPKDFHNFSIEKEHPTIMQEAYAILEQVLKPAINAPTLANPRQPIKLAA